MSDEKRSLEQRLQALRLDIEGRSKKTRLSYIPPNSELDPLEDAIAKLQAERERVGNKQTATYKLDAKTAILSLVEMLDKSVPAHLVASTANSDELPGITAAPVATIGSHLQEIQNLQSASRFETDKTKRAALNEESLEKVDALRKFIYAQRERIQPHRPQLKHNNRITPFIFAQTAAWKYEPFVRAFAAASAQEYREQRSAGNRLPFANLPNINQVAKEAQAFVAMLDFSHEVEEILKVCNAKAYAKDLFPASRQIPVRPGRDLPEYDAEQHPEDIYWAQNREEMSDLLQQAAERFNRAIAPLHLKVGSTSPAYRHCIEAERRILQARTYAGVAGAHEALKHHATLFVLGGHDYDNDVHYNKLLTRIGEAYAADRIEVAKQASDYEHHADSDRYPFINPLNERSKTLDKVYEARWALAADAVEDLLGDYRKLIANPQITGLDDFPPSNVVSEVQRKPRAPRYSRPARMTQREERALMEELTGATGLDDETAERALNYLKEQREWRPPTRGGRG